MLRRPVLLSSPAAGESGGIDEDCLALIRPVYSGGVWAPGDASPYARSVTTVGTLSSVAGPWGADNTALYDATYDHYAYTPGSSDFIPASVRDVDFWAQILERPTVNKVLFRLGVLSIEYQGFTVYYGPGSAGKIRFLISSRTSISNQIPVYSGSYDYADGVWHHLRATCPGSSGVFRFWVDGIYQGASTSHTPTFGSSPNLIVGAEKSVAGWPWNSISRMAEIRVSSVYRWPTDDSFAPPTGPYTE